MEEEEEEKGGALLAAAGGGAVANVREAWGAWRKHTGGVSRCVEVCV